MNDDRCCIRAFHVGRRLLSHRLCLVVIRFSEVTDMTGRSDSNGAA